MTPRQESLSGVIICPGIEGTAVKGQLLALFDLMILRCIQKSTEASRGLPTEQTSVDGNISALALAIVGNEQIQFCVRIAL
jgi:hypothetical protein